MSSKETHLVLITRVVVTTLLVPVQVHDDADAEKSVEAALQQAQYSPPGTFAHVREDRTGTVVSVVPELRPDVA